MFSVSLHSLPNDTFRTIIGYLEVDCLLVIAQVSKTLESFASSDFIWKNYFIAKYGTLDYTSNFILLLIQASNFKKEYLRRRQKFRQWKLTLCTKLESLSLHQRNIVGTLLIAGFPDVSLHL